MHTFWVTSVATALCLFGLSCEGTGNPNEAVETDREPDSDTDAEADSDTGESSLDALYRRAVHDAVFADSDEIATDLIAVATDDERVIWMEDADEARVLMATWTSYPDSFPPGETVSNDWGDLWVTVVPELRTRLNTLGDTSSLRIAQLLGMPGNADNSHIAELWVRPSDLFRPCPDNEITDNSCEPDLPPNAESGYVEWYEDNILSSYFPPAYPWTRLGYTYDWAPNSDEQGLSEFVIRAGSSFAVDSLRTTETYFAAE